MSAPEGRHPMPSVHGMRPLLEPNTIVLKFEGSPERADVPLLCRRARRLLLGADAATVVCDVEAILDPNMALVDALARLRLDAGRTGRRICLRGACTRLKELIGLSGLDDLFADADLSVESGWKSEERE